MLLVAATLDQTARPESRRHVETRIFSSVDEEVSGHPNLIEDVAAERASSDQDNPSPDNATTLVTSTSAYSYLTSSYAPLSGYLSSFWGYKNADSALKTD